MKLAIKMWRECKKLVSDSQTKKYAFERQVYTEHDTRLNDKLYIFFHRKMFAFSVGVRVHISSVLNWFSFRLHFISANSFCDAFTCIRTDTKLWSRKLLSGELYRTMSAGWTILFLFVQILQNDETNGENLI